MTNTIGERIKQRRKELGFNAEHLAKKLGVSRSTIFRYEKGDIEKVPVEVVSVLAEILNTTPEYLMGWVSNSNMEKAVNLLNQLDDNRQTDVINYAKEQLRIQNSTPLIFPNNSIDTIAAHSPDRQKKYSQDELDMIQEYADLEIEKYKKKHNLD